MHMLQEFVPATPAESVSPDRHVTMVLVDDNASIPTEMVERLDARPGFQLLDTVTDLELALREIRSTRPNVVLLNLPQRGEEAVAFAAALRDETPAPRVIVMGLDPSQADVEHFVIAGVAGFIVADATFEVCRSTIQSVAHGRKVLPETLLSPLFCQLREARSAEPESPILSVETLTRRERTVTDLIALGMSNVQIAAHLNISTHTVKGHVHRALGKLDLKTRLELSAFARKRILPSTPGAGNSIEGGAALA